MSVLPISTNRPPARQQPQRGVHELAGQGVQHHVHARGRRSRPERCLELERPRRGDVPRSSPQAAQHVPLAGARGARRPRAQVPGQLHRGHADAAGGGVDQHRLARPQARPGRPARSRRSGTPPAPPPPRANDQPPGSGPAAARRSPPPGRTRPANRPITGRPAARPVTPGPASSDHPGALAAQQPGARPGTCPARSARRGSSRPAARTPTRTCPAASGSPLGRRLRPASGSPACRVSATSSRHPADPPARSRRGLRGTDQARHPQSLPSHSEVAAHPAQSRLDQPQGRFIQVGIYVREHQPARVLRLADRTRPHTAAPARSVDLVTASRAAPRPGSPPPAARRRTGRRPATAAPGPGPDAPDARIPSGTAPTARGDATTTTSGIASRAASPVRPAAPRPASAPSAVGTALAETHSTWNSAVPHRRPTASVLGNRARTPGKPPMPPGRPVASASGQRHACRRRRRQPHPQPGGARRVQRHARPRERQRAVHLRRRPSAPGRRVQRRVQQRRVQPEPVGRRLRRAARPRRTPRRRAATPRAAPGTPARSHARPRQAVVQSRRGHRSAPAGGHWARSNWRLAAAPGASVPAGMPASTGSSGRRLASASGRSSGAAAGARPARRPRPGPGRRPRSRERQRRLQGQLLQRARADLVARRGSPAPRTPSRAAAPSRPPRGRPARVGAQRQPPGQHHAARLAAAPPPRPAADGPAAAGPARPRPRRRRAARPVPLVLERVRRQVHPRSRRGEAPRPVHRDAPHVHLGQRRHEPAQPAVATAQRPRHRHHIHLRRREGVLNPPASAPDAATDLHEHPVPRHRPAPAPHGETPPAPASCVPVPRPRLDRPRSTPPSPPTDHATSAGCGVIPSSALSDLAPAASPPAAECEA